MVMVRQFESRVWSRVPSILRKRGTRWVRLDGAGRPVHSVTLGETQANPAARPAAKGTP